MNNCPNCGAPINGEKCPFCGTVFIDWAVIDMNNPFYLKFKYRDSITRGRCICEKFAYAIQPDEEIHCSYDNSSMLITPNRLTYTMDIHLRFLPNKDGIVLTKIDTKIADQETLKGVIDNG